MNVALRPSLNLISLCTGGGGLDLGVELAIPSARSVVLVEREAFACSHLVSAMQQGLMAQAALWSDVTTFSGRPWRGLVDGLIGGIPCQPHSLAGKRLGEEDERDLWSDARRIIVQSGIWFVLIENVRGMLSSGGAERVWRDLRRLGFKVEIGLFTAAEVGASHERERVFFLAVADARRSERWTQDRGRSVADWRAAGRSEDSSRLREPSLKLAHAGRECDERWRGTGDVLCSPSAPEIKGHQWQWHGDAPDDRRHDLADAIGSGLEEIKPRAVTRPGHEGTTVERSSGPMGDSTCEGGRSLSVQSGRQIQAGPFSLRASLFPPGPSDLRSWANILAAAPELKPAFRRVADGLASRLDIARVDRLRLLGNGVVSLQAAYALRTLATRLAASGSASAVELVGMMTESFILHEDKNGATR